MQGAQGIQGIQGIQGNQGPAGTPGLPRSYLAGHRISNNAATPNTKLDVAAGACRSDDNTTDIILATSGTIDFGVVGADGLDIGTIVLNKTYFIFVIRKADGTTARSASQSPTSPALPSGYTKQRRIGTWLTNIGAASLQTLIQTGDEFMKVSNPGRDYSNAGGVAAGAHTITLNVPIGISVYAIHTGEYYNANLSQAGLSIYPVELNYIAGYWNMYTFTFVQEGTYGNGWGIIRTKTNTLGQIIARTSASSGTLYISSLGWIDRRGQDDEGEKYATSYR